MTFQQKSIHCYLSYSLCLSAILILIVFFHSPLNAQSIKTPTNTVQIMMQNKLQNTNELFAAMIAKDYERINKSAKLLGTIGKATEWHRPDDADFQHYAVSFQNSIDSILENSTKKNYEGVAMGYMRLTMSCMYCHNNVRFSDPKYQDPKSKPSKTK